MTAALTAEGLHTYYGKSHILHGVSLEVEEGKITALLGRNGAGKSTTLRSLMGLTPARQGKITIFGQDTTHWPKGVWTLPPVFALGEMDRARYAAIGEADNFVLLFRNP